MGAGIAPADPFIPLPDNREITSRQQIGKPDTSGEKGSACAGAIVLGFALLKARPNLARLDCGPLPLTIRVVPVAQLEAREAGIRRVL